MDVSLRLGVILRVFPVDVDTVETTVSQKLDSTAGKSFAALGSCYRTEIGRVRPSTNGEKYFEVPILFLEKVNLLDTAVSIIALLIPGICGIVFLQVRVAIGEMTIQKVSTLILGTYGETGRVRRTLLHYRHGYWQKNL